jgi:hypothetical protein
MSIWVANGALPPCWIICFVGRRLLPCEVEWMYTSFIYFHQVLYIKSEYQLAPLFRNQNQGIRFCKNISAVPHKLLSFSEEGWFRKARVPRCSCAPKLDCEYYRPIVILLEPLPKEESLNICVRWHLSKVQVNRCYALCSFATERKRSFSPSEASKPSQVYQRRDCLPNDTHFYTHGNSPWQIVRH